MRQFTRSTIAGIALVSLTALTACGKGSGDVDWATHGFDRAETRFSPLDEINTGNIERLGLAWSLDLPDENALQATPLAIDGKIYFPGGFGRVYAVDAISGKLDWMFDAKDVETDPLAAARIYGVNRGVAFHDGKVFYASRDGRMIALDAKTGKPVWTTHFLKPQDNSASTGAPRVFGDKLIIGSSGAEEGARGFVTALDTKTGKILWRFYIVPGNPAKGFEDEAQRRAAATWSGEWWKYGGGGNAWNGITYDPEFGQLLIGTGNGGPWNCHERSNAPDKTNLYLASVVAIDEKTGKYKWHYQYNPRECWDWKATSAIVLTKMKFDGAERKVLMQAPSNGFFYVIDRSNGKLLAADKWAKANWADRIDLKTGLPVERPGVRYENGGPVDIWPGTYGAHSWQAMAYNPDSGLVYIPYMQMGLRWSVNDESRDLAARDLDKPRLRTGVNLELATDGDPRDNLGSLIAWDPVKKKIAWRADYPVFFTGGAMTTHGGLVFHGTLGGYLYAYDARTGREVWKYNAKLGIFAPPISYSVKGRQYVSILVGPGGGSGEITLPNQDHGWKYGVHPRRLLTFVLDGKAKLPETPPPDRTVAPLDNATMQIDPARVKRGQQVYSVACTFCHGGEAVANGNAPDLRESGIAFDRASFRQVVKDGSLMSRGMPKIIVSDEELEDLYHFIRNAARIEAQRQASEKKKG